MVVAWGDSQGLKTVSRAPAAMKQVQGDKKRVVIPGSTRNRKDKLINIAPATLKQVQGDKNHAVILGSTRNRKDEVDKHCPRDPETGLKWQI